MAERLKNFVDVCVKKYSSLKILDKYLLKQIIMMFLMGVFVFSTIIFASDTFITLIKQITQFGIPFKVALIMILLNLPSVVVLSIPMGVLLSTVMVLNKLSLASEITVMRSCGIGLNRIAKPIFIFAFIMSLATFVINESVAPVMSKQSKDLALWALGQKNIPEGKENFVFKELGDNWYLKRLFYVGKCSKKTLYNVTVLDNAKPGTIQVLQAREGKTSPEGWLFQKGAIYTIDTDGQVLNTTLFDNSTVKYGLDLSRELNKNLANEMNFVALAKYVSKADLSPEDKRAFTVQLFDKLALPLATIVFVLVGVPLAITPPRVRYNRGFLFSILIIFAFYVLRALSISFGNAGSISPFIAAWLPDLILAVFGFYLYYKKVYTIE
ncbi:LptF/LptG family permease [bacterium]|nr:LptF/LptG family permease [bacterium]